MKLDRSSALLLLVALAGCAQAPVAPTAAATATTTATRFVRGDLDLPPPESLPVPGRFVRGDLGLPDPSTLPLPPTPPARPLRLKAVGDIMLGTDYPTDRLPADDGRGQLARVRDLLRDADVTFGNVEGALADGLPPVKVCQDPAACYLFRSPTRFVTTLADAGFDVASLANNHARDFGEEGRSSSMAALDGVGIVHSGRDGTVASWTVDGSRLALIAFAPNSGSTPLNDLEGAVAKVRALTTDHDLVIVSFHGGGEGADRTRVIKGMEEFRGEQRGDLVRFAHAVIDAGADLVIGHGPHVPRALERYQDRLIAYSLGNFATYYGISIAGVTGHAPILEVELARDGRLLSGRIHSNLQERPTGVVPDPQQRAFALIRELTALDFDGGGLGFRDDGGFAPRAAPDESSTR